MFDKHISTLLITEDYNTKYDDFYNMRVAQKMLPHVSFLCSKLSKRGEIQCTVFLTYPALGNKVPEFPTRCLWCNQNIIS